MQISKDDFFIDSSFLFRPEHRFVVICGNAASGKSTLLFHLKNFYKNVFEIPQFDYDFSKRNRLDNFRNLRDVERMVLYNDDVLLHEAIDINKLKSTVTTNCLNASYDQRVHRVFITSNTYKNLIFDDTALNSSIVENVPTDLLRTADLVLKIEKAEGFFFLKVVKDRAANNLQTMQYVNFFKSLAMSYSHSLQRFDLKNCVVRNIRRYSLPDFSRNAVSNFTELFGYYK